MYTSVQSVFLIDVNNCSDVCYTKEDLERHVRKIKLCCLRLLTEFGAQTEKGREVVRWACKYYDSRCFKPATANKNFADFKRCAFESFENEVTDRYERAFETRNEGPEDESSKNLNFKPHCYILNKALQEVLLDYNWDRPDISSPVKPVRRKSLVRGKTVVENEGAYNAVVVFTRVPSSLQQVWEFCGATPSDQLTAEDWLLNVLDPASFKGFQEDKQLRLYFVDVSDESICSQYASPLFTTLQGGLRQLQGGLFSISQIIQSTVQKVGRSDHDADFDGSDEQLFQAPDELVGHPVFPISVTWWQGHKARGKGRRSRRPQPGPKLVWEDNTGCSFLQVPLEVLAVHGSSSRPWGYAWVVSVIASHAMSVVAIAGSAAQLYVCREPSNETFATIIKVLAQQQLTMILKLEGGGLALLSPWTGGVGCLAIMSSSHLATPPLKVSQEQQEASADEHLLEFVQQTVKKCLSNAPRHETGEPLQTTKAFCTTHIEKWYRPHHGHSHVISRFKKTVNKRPERKAMLERVQKKYKPNIPTPLAAGEVGVCDLVDITQLETGTPAITAPQAKKAQTSVSRAQQLLKKSRIVTAQQKVKDQRAEEEERVQASERRAAQASERTRKSQALASQALNTVSDPMDSQQLVKSIIAIRDGKSVGGYNEMECDLFTTAQTIINVALTHIRKSSSKDIEGGLGSILGEGVFQSTTEISKNTNGEEQLRHFKLQALLHLEVLWILGFSTSECEDKENEDNPVRDYHIDETVKMLRSISLKHNPVTMTTFLQEVILENYADTLGEVLVEIYEELNQPLPPQLTALTDDPASVKSHASSVMSCVVGSLENAESNRSREGRNKVARQLSILEAPKRQIVVPVMNRTLRRTMSETIKPQPQNSGEPSQTAESGELRSVRRSLFELEEPGASKGKMKRSQTVSSIPTTQHRQSPRKAVKKNLQITPKKSKSQINKKREKAHSAPSGLPKGEKTPTSKRSLLVPETPYNKAGQNIYFKHRLRKSTGSTVVNESPDLKRLPCKTTPRRLRASLTLNRRSSFYSGARSRNWERAKNQLLADRIRGSYDRRSLDLGQLKNTSDASFLFSEILSSTQDEVLHNGADDETPVKENDNIPQRVLSFGLDDCQKEENSSLQKSNLERPNNHILLEDSPSRNTRAALNAKSPSQTLTKENISTPLKNVRRSLSLGTPCKDVKSENGNYVPHCPVTPRRGKSLLDVLTPSKRVQFDFNNTPSKSSSPTNLNQTPRSILKTPQRTPNKTPNKTPCKTPGRTPNKLLFRSPDFAGFSNKKSPRTPVRTPTRTPPRFERTSLQIAVHDVRNFSVTETESSVNCDGAVPETPLKGMSSFSDDSGGLVPETPVKEVDMYSRLVSGVEGNRLEIEPLENGAAEVLTGVEECVDHMEEMPLLQDIRIDLDSDALGGLENNEEIGMPVIPIMAPEDIELVSTLMFSTDPDPDSGHGTAEFLEGEEDVDSDIKNILNTLSTPVKGGISPSKEMSCSTSVDGSGLKLNLQNVFDILKSPVRKGKTPDKLTGAVESFRAQCRQEQTPEQEKVKLNDGVSPEIALSKSFKLYMERMAKELSRLNDRGTPEKTPRALAYGTGSPVKAQASQADVDETPEKRIPTSDNSEESPEEGTTQGNDKANPEGITKIPAGGEVSTEKRKIALSDSKTNPEKKRITPVKDNTSPEKLTTSSEDESSSKTSPEQISTSSENESTYKVSPEKMTSSEDELSPKASSEKMTSSEDELSPKASPEKRTSSEDESSIMDKRTTTRIDEGNTLNDKTSPERRKNPTNSNVSSEERIIFKKTAPEDDKASSEKSKYAANGKTSHRKKGTTLAEGNSSPVKRTSVDRVKRERCITPEFNEVKPENRRTVPMNDEGTPEKRSTTSADYKVSPRKRKIISANCKVNLERRRASPSDDEGRVSSDKVSLEKRTSSGIGKRKPERRTSLRRGQTSPEESSGTTSDDKVSQTIATSANSRVRPEKRKSTQPLNKTNQKKRRTALVDDNASLEKRSVSAGDRAGLEETAFKEDQTIDFEARNVVSQVADGLQEDKTADSEARNEGTLAAGRPRVDKENLEEEDQPKKSRSSRRKLVMTDCKTSLSFDEDTEDLPIACRKTVLRKRRSDCDLLIIDKGKSSSGSEEDSLSLLGRLRKRKKKCRGVRLRKRTRLFEEDSDFSSPQSKLSQWELKVTPLRNLENLPSRRESEQSEAYQDQEYDRRKEPILSTPLSHGKVNKSPDSRHKQQKIDMYLSPVPKQCCNVEIAVARLSSTSSSTPTRKRPETPNDWKRVKPRHEKQKIKNPKAEQESSVDKVSISSGYSLTEPHSVNELSKENTSTSKAKGKGKSRRHKGVKLKLTKSGEHYQVSSNNVHDSSNDQDKSLNSSQEKFEESFQSTQEVSSVKKHKKKKKKEKNACVITPLRFTRHMSKDLSVSPELFQRLITLSPDRSASQDEEKLPFGDEELGAKVEEELEQQFERLDSEFESPEDTIVSDSDSDYAPPGVSFGNKPPINNPRPTRNTKQAVEAIWSVHTLPGSPITTKTFVRKQKKMHEISHTPKVKLTSITSKEPSPQSLMQLTNSPIIQPVRASSSHIPTTQLRSRKRLYRGRRDS